MRGRETAPAYRRTRLTPAGGTGTLGPGSRKGTQLSTSDSTPPAEGANEPAEPTSPPTPPTYTPPPAYTAPPAYSPPATPPYGAQPPYGSPPEQPAYGQPAEQPSGQPAEQPPAYGAPAGQPGAYGQPAYAQPAYGQPAYGQPAYGQPAYGGAYGYGEAKTNVLALVSMIASIAGVTVLPVLGSLAGAIMGHIALRQIATTGEKGRGMALTGVILGWVGLALLILVIVLIVLFALAASSQRLYY